MSIHCAGITLPYFVAAFFLYGSLILLIDKGILFKRGGNPAAEKRHLDNEYERKDDDVENEELRVANSINSDPEHIQALNLKKVYITENKQEVTDNNATQSEIQAEKKDKKKVKFYRAVKDISFGVNKGECFVLLGINGAGKTTTFKCLIGEIPQTDGSLKLNG